MDSLAKRIKSVRIGADLNRSAFARSLGVSAAHISAVEKGKPASEAFLKLVALKYKVQEEWLLRGAAMSVSQTQQPFEPRGKWQPSLTIEELTGIHAGLGMGCAVDLLSAIYASKDEALIRAIYSNLQTFAGAVREREKRLDIEAALNKLKSETNVLREEVSELRAMVLQAPSLAANYLGPERRNGADRRQEVANSTLSSDRRGGDDRRGNALNNHNHS